MPQKILIADDETQVQKLLARAFGASSYDVLSAADGKEALDLVAAHSPDLVLLDINMPCKTGWDVLRELRKNIHTRMLPVILLTGNGEVKDEVAGLEMGADDYVTKPFALEELQARVRTLLRRSRMSLSANPLTKLPGSPMIEEEVAQLIREKIPFAFFYIDIDRFKAYNDVYGFAQGDEVIKGTARIIAQCVRSETGDAGFVGHVGGDDFVAICSLETAPHVAMEITTRFDTRAPGFYAPADRDQGYVETQDRLGKLQRFPIMTLSIGIVTTERRALTHYAKVVQIASEMKAYFKSRQGGGLSRFLFDRRRDPERA